jgi:hypothetical protein
MREIEVNRYMLAAEADRAFSAPRMDWSWARADRLLRGLLKDSASPPQPSAASNSYVRAWLLPHVAMPHVITFLMSLLLFGLGYFGYLAGFELGALGAATH